MAPNTTTAMMTNTVSQDRTRAVIDIRATG